MAVAVDSRGPSMTAAPVASTTPTDCRASSETGTAQLASTGARLSNRPINKTMAPVLARLEIVNPIRPMKAISNQSIGRLGVNRFSTSVAAMPAMRNA